MTEAIRPKWSSVMVIWWNAHGGDGGWETVSKTHSTPVRCVTVGMVAAHNARGITLALNRSPQIDKKRSYYIGGYTFIPACNITRIIDLASPQVADTD